MPISHKRAKTSDEKIEDQLKTIKKLTQVPKIQKLNKSEMKAATLGQSLKYLPLNYLTHY